MEYQSYCMRKLRADGVVVQSLKHSGSDPELTNQFIKVRE